MDTARNARDVVPETRTIATKLQHYQDDALASLVMLLERMVCGLRRR